MPGPVAPLRIALLLLVATVGPPGVFSEENVGCLFSERLCLEDEWCFDDYAFGRCLQATSDVDEDDLYRYNLEREVLHQISRELRRLFALGYRWSHAYTQCRLQAMLYATQHESYFDANSCSHLVDQDLEGALKALEGQLPIDPREVAIIKYTPSIEDPNADFADEVFYPPVDDSSLDQALRDKILGPNAIDIMDMEDPYALYEVMKRNRNSLMDRRPLEIFDERYNNNPSSDYIRSPPQDDLEFLPNNAQLPLEDELDTFLKLYPLLKQLQDNADAKVNYPSILPEHYDKLERLLREFEESERNSEDPMGVFRKQYEIVDGNDSPYEKFTSTYNTPDSFRAGWESRDILPFASEDIPESRIYFDENEPSEAEKQEEYGSGDVLRGFSARFTDDDGQNVEEVFRELKHKEKLSGPVRNPGIYTEGGVVYAPGTQSDEDGTSSSSRETARDMWKDNLDKILTKYNLGFKRPERLDVKKPGPPFDSQMATDGRRAIPPKTEAAEGQVGNNDNKLLPSMMKKGPIGAHPNPTHEIDFDFDIDSNYIYVEFTNIFHTWREGNYIINNITKLLKFQPHAYPYHNHVHHNEVVFKVVPNDRGWDATEVARRIDAIKDKLKEATGVEITEIGIGDKVDRKPIVDSAHHIQKFYYMGIIVASGILCAMILAASLLLLIKKHLKSKEKLQGISRPDTEASKDYQDLCRARMAMRGQQPAGETVHGRITSLSRESEQSPSSRSSTSSWSEEPALHNMDISTGHMVLSYMEDHLKNKDRLDQEWIALCAYVAEPCETSVASKKENAEKNRYPEIIPYDHSRVVLNELSNASSSDYINASSITDHDPRNPAYIATQGPLPHTAADLWQLIWEQGAVVIVMLSRLTESGTAMCHRYWPEEGSELYHIHEVHLVSEHIWCDDYLVRSFYLKNARTGETRTVTQFHFLSWPESGVPASTKALLEFRRKVNKSYRGRSCPIVVHCSDGAGRTGTYCLIDMVLSRMAKGAKEIDIAATLEHLRDQRPKMVATKQQFEFVLTAVAEEVHAILKALPPQPTPTQMEKEKQ